MASSFVGGAGLADIKKNGTSSLTANQLRNMLASKTSLEPADEKPEIEAVIPRANTQVSDPD